MSELTMKYNPAFLNDETLIRTFVVRHREFAAVMESVRDNTSDANQHVLVIGPRGSGKSTLVLRVAAEIRQDPELKQQWYPVVYGEESYLVTNAGEFWLEALLQVAEQTGEDRWHEAHAGLLKELDSDRLAHRALAQLMDFADERGVRLLFVVENLHQLVGSQINDDDEMWAIRKKLQTEPRIMLLGTATRRFDQIDNQNQALYEFFRLIELDPLDSLDEIGDLWSLAGNTDTPRDFLRPVEILTGGNPRLIRILSEFAAKTSFRDLMENLVHLMDEHTEYFKHHLDKLPPKERKVFVALADLWDPGTASDIAAMARMSASAVSAQLKRLEERGAVCVVDQRGRAKVYQVAERLYNIYHLMRRRGQASARVKAAVRFMVRYYEGERLVPAVRALVAEAGKLDPTYRQDHYLAYDEVLNRTNSDLRLRIVTETIADLYALSDLPGELRNRIETEVNPYASVQLAELIDIEIGGLDLFGAYWLERTLLEKYRNSPPTEVLEALAKVQKRASDLNPSDPRWLYNRSVALWELGRYDEALQDSNRALDLEPSDSSAHYSRGNALVGLKRYEDAIVAYKRAIELQPDYARAHQNMGGALADVGRPIEALRSLSIAIGLDPDDPIAHYNLGSVLMDLGRYEEALESTRLALELRPGDAETLQNYGAALFGLGRYSEALAAFDHALELKPYDWEISNSRGVVLAVSGNPDDAIESFDAAIELEPEHLGVHLNRINALVEINRYDEALSSLKKIAYTEVSVGLIELAQPSILMSADGYTAQVLEILEASPLAHDIEPLLVALRMDLNEAVDVAKEIEEVAKDILHDIQKLRSAEPRRKRDE